jgi:hypothetical protein
VENTASTHLFHISEYVLSSQDQERQKMEMECGAQIWAKDRKLKLVSNIINGEAASSSSSETKIKVPPPVAPKPRSRMKPASSDTSISTAGTSSSSTAYYSAKSTNSSLKKTKTPPTTPSTGSVSLGNLYTELEVLVVQA